LKAHSPSRRDHATKPRVACAHLSAVAIFTKAERGLPWERGQKMPVNLEEVV